jgi:putative oxidoreductase
MNKCNLDRIFERSISCAIVLIRLMVGRVFLTEGFQKFLYPDVWGVGRFTKIGIPLPHLLAPSVGVVEMPRC